MSSGQIAGNKKPAGWAGSGRSLVRDLQSQTPRHRAARIAVERHQRADKVEASGVVIEGRFAENGGGVKVGGRKRFASKMDLTEHIANRFSIA